MTPEEIARLVGLGFATPWSDPDRALAGLPLGSLALSARLSGPRDEVVRLVWTMDTGWVLEIEREGRPTVRPLVRSQAAALRMAELYIRAAVASGFKVEV